MTQYWNEMKTTMDKIYAALQDEESRRLFDARVEYMISRDSDLYVDRIFELNHDFPKKWRCREIERVLKNNQKIIIYGCGHDGKISKRVLEICGYEIWCWCDSNSELTGTQIDGKPVIFPEELMPKYQDCLLIVGSKRYEIEIRRRLYDVGFPVENTFSFVYNQGLGSCGNQYFDVFPPKEQEIFVDAGAYNGDSIQRFMDWGGWVNITKYMQWNH